jgi:hypothetical protein
MPYTNSILNYGINCREQPSVAALFKDDPIRVSSLHMMQPLYGKWVLVPCKVRLAELKKSLLTPPGGSRPSVKEESPCYRHPHLLPSLLGRAFEGIFLDLTPLTPLPCEGRGKWGPRPLLNSPFPHQEGGEGIRGEKTYPRKSG